MSRLLPVPVTQYAPGPASSGFPITPSDSELLPQATRKIFVGGAGDLAVILNEDGPATMTVPETLDSSYTSTNLTLSDGDLTALNDGNTTGTTRTLDAVSSGKWQVELTVTNAAGGSGGAVAQILAGILVAGFSNAQKMGLSTAGQNSVAVGSSDAATLSTLFYNGNSGEAYPVGSNFANGDIMGLCLDLTTGANVLHVFKNGAELGTGFSLTGVSLGGLSWYFGASLFFDTTNPQTVFNFGASAFAHPVAGYEALVHTTLSTPLVFKAVPAGTMLEISAALVTETDTTATEILGLV